MSKTDIIKKMIKLLLSGVVVGAACGLVGSLFHHVLHFSSEAFYEHNWFIYLLIPCGLLIVFLYNVLRVGNSYSTVSVIKAIRNKVNLPNGLSISIFLSTALTHLFGGSSGREGAALQLGGSIGDAFTDIKWLRFGTRSRQAVVMCGMTGLFAALFGTPLAAAVFVLTIINIKDQYKIALLPCMVSSYTAFFIAKLLGNSGVRYTIPTVALGFDSAWKTLLIAALCGVISIGFVWAMENTKKLACIIKNEYIRICVGGAAVILLTIIVGSNDYNTPGSGVIELALSGSARPEAFLLKIIFTAITLSFGYKGGEIVPSFFVGATFGCVMGALIGIDPAFAAGIGMMAVFCGVTNCPLATVVMSAEVFGLVHLPYFVPACAVAFVLSGRHSLYGSRTLMLNIPFISKKKAS